MLKVMYILLPLIITTIGSVAGFIFDFNSLSDTSYLSSKAEAIEAGIVWGVFIGLFFVPISLKCKKFGMFSSQSITLWLSAGLISFFCNPVFFYLSQVA